jgi:hypothetical protein
MLHVRVGKSPHAPHPEPGTILWRYMDLAKFMSLLESRALHFSRYDQFRDSFEGLLSRPTLESYRQGVGFKDDPKLFREFERWINKLGRKYAYASCWNAGPYERAVLWSNYGSTIAIQTTADNFKACFLDAPDRELVMLAHLRYGDLSVLDMEKDNVWRPLTYKDIRYEDEHEVRAIYIDDRYRLESSTGAPKPPRSTPKGVLAAIDPNVLIEQVFVAPGTAPWLLKLVRSICARYGIDAPVAASHLKQRG